MLLKSIQLQNLLSFGPDTEPLALEGLNVLIGPNGSGKSNLIEAISLLQSAPRSLADPVRDGGGVADWLWKGADRPVAVLDVVVENPKGRMPLRHVLQFTETARRFELVGERIENERAYPGHDRPHFFYQYQNGRPILNVKEEHRELRREDVDPEQSILSQRKDPDQYPEVTYLGEQLGKIRIYREWSFGRYAPPRRPQPADQPTSHLTEDCRNLGLVLNSLGNRPPLKKKLLEAIRGLYDGIEDFHVSIEGGTVQVFFHEGSMAIPATRLSDGTLRYLCLLVVLCHPSPPPLLCIEEPELGLHPDVLPGLCDLMKEASERTQLIVTTHSDTLVDALTDQPQSVIVCEKVKGSTVMRRLDRQELKAWLEKYALGRLWIDGQLGGTRW